MLWGIPLKLLNSRSEGYLIFPANSDSISYLHKGLASVLNYSPDHVYFQHKINIEKKHSVNVFLNVNILFWIYFQDHNDQNENTDMITGSFDGKQTKKLGSAVFI